MSIKNFTAAELTCKCGCGLLRPASGFHEKLQELRDAFGFPMPINSACRCTAHNKAVGGAARSYHIGDSELRDFGYCAVDVRFPAEHEHREEFIIVAMKHGWSIGLHRRFVHIDRRSDYDNTKRVIFAY